jgi:rare lipoprotein A
MKFVSVASLASLMTFGAINNGYSGDVLASYYDVGRGRTASGTRHRFGVAHKTLPFGTQVRLTNPRNGRSLVAVVDDRGPFTGGRSLDLQRPGASFLGYIGRGVARLKMELLGRISSTHKKRKYR